MRVTAFGKVSAVCSNNEEAPNSEVPASFRDAASFDVGLGLTGFHRGFGGGSSIDGSGGLSCWNISVDTATPPWPALLMRIGSSGGSWVAQRAQVAMLNVRATVTFEMAVVAFLGRWVLHLCEPVAWWGQHLSLDP